MPLKEIWLGPLLGNNRSRLIDRCASYVSAGTPEQFLYLAASHPLLEIITEGILDHSKCQGTWGELPVFLFRGFVRRILSTAVFAENGTAITPRTPIDREELPLKRSLISQILRKLNNDNRLPTLGPLSGRDGCVNTVASLIGEIQRAAKSPAEFNSIIASRAAEYEADRNPADDETFLQVDFDREVALIYEIYSQLLEQNSLTDQDADGLRALAVLRGELAETPVALPWLQDVRLLVLDGFFDFTPVQGEILRLLIPRIPEVIVNLNGDRLNPEIFKPFQETIEGLSSIADFTVISSEETAPKAPQLAPLRERLFNPSISTELVESTARQECVVKYLECTDRETEIRAIAKEIKRLILEDHYHLQDIALIVRERASYAETIARVMREEAVPCNVDRRVLANEIPAARALIKLLAIVESLSNDNESGLKMPQLADQIKSGYFRLSRPTIERLEAEFTATFSYLLTDSPDHPSYDQNKRRFGIGRWDADALENAIAYVGSELRLTNWIERCRKLIAELPSAEATKELLHIETAEPVSDDEDTQLEDAETAKPEERREEKKRRHQRDLHPAAIAWSMLVIKEFATVIQSVPLEGDPISLRSSLVKLLRQFQFRAQVQRPVRHATDSELVYATMDLHALEAIRRGFVAAIRCIHLTGSPSVAIPITSYIDEVKRSLSAQEVSLGTGERGGLRVLAATDVRGLRFRTLFIAGLVEGGFPLSAARDWIYPHEERERLKQYGLALEDISPNTLLKEEHYFYQAACRATERLYLTRPLLLEGDTETVASYYVEELRRAVSPGSIECEAVIRPDFDGREVRARRASSPRELAIGLVRQEQRQQQGLDPTDLLPQSQIRSLLTLARNDGFVSHSALARIEIERHRAGNRFGPYDGQITHSELLALLRQRFGSEAVYSASGLSTFGNCPYRFFAQRVLQLEPRGEAALDLQALDAGKLLHDILRRFFENHREERLAAHDKKRLTAELMQLADEVFDQHQKVVPPLNKQIWKLDRELRKIILEQVLLYEIEYQEKCSKVSVKPARFELAFGGTKSAAKDPNSKDQPLRLTRKSFVGEESALINGQIDRVDISDDNTVIAYDYKLSRGAKREDILSGRQLQIPIYLAALEQIFFPGQPIAGGGYYTLRGNTNRRNSGLYRKEYQRYLGLGTINALYSEVDWHKFRADIAKLIWDFIDRMRAGSFIVDPSQGKETCRFCDYTAMCRYERYRIQNKKRGSTN